MASKEPSVSHLEEFRPVLAPRKGEFSAWGLSLLVCIAWATFELANLRLPSALPYLAFVLLSFSVIISLSNWTDRRTIIRLEDSGVGFGNGLRNVYFHWNDIHQVQKFTSSWGNKVRVLGKQTYFDFRTLAEVKYKGEIRGRMGFAEGERIFQYILEKTGLREVEHSGSGYYYVRE